MKLNKYILIIIPFLFFLFLIGCDKGNILAPEDDGPYFYGQVLDKNRQPVEGVGIHYMPELIEVDNEGNFLNKPMPSTVINFNIPKETLVDLVILRYGTRDTVAVLIKNEKMEAGYHIVTLDEKNLTNGVYTYVLKIGDLIIERNMLLLILSWRDLSETEPLTKTDKNGHFKLSYKMLGIGVEFLRTGEIDPTPAGKSIISENISLFMVKEGFQWIIEPMTLDTTITITKTFRLKKKE